ncbi:14640_t:CDS:2 [Gigaspora rosea]|nr:14640_t:CDS:2 [Gigaspora rosea]
MGYVNKAHKEIYKAREFNETDEVNKSNEPGEVNQTNEFGKINESGETNRLSEDVNKAHIVRKTGKAYEMREIENISKAREVNETGEVNKSNELGEVNETNELGETNGSSDDKPGEVNKESNSYFNELCLNGKNTEFKGFNIRLGRSTIVGTEMRKRTIECQNSGLFKAKNPENPGTSVKQGCPWHINFSRPLKQNIENLVYITTLEDTHNHEMSIEALQFEKLKAFTKDMRDDIEFYVKKYSFDATTIKRILSQKYPLHPIYPQDLYNEIKKHRPSAQLIEGDAARFYESMLAKQREDPRWFIEAKWKTETCTPRHLLCIWHIKENLKKALCGKLGDSFSAFYSAFWQCRNSDIPKMFNRYWEKIIINYPAASQYLENHLYERRRAWACGFLTTLFTLGIESTSFIESQNACIKRILENSNTSLCELGKVVMNQVEEQMKKNHFEDWKRSIPLTANTVIVFPTIEALIRRYLRPNVMQYLINQMKESIYYTATRSSIEEIKSMPINEPFQYEDLEDEFDSVFICAQFLLQQLDEINVVELIAPRWISKEYRQEVATEPDHFGQRFVNSITENNENKDNKRFNRIQPFYNTSEQSSNENKGFVKKLLFYGRVWGLARTATKKCLLYHDKKFVKIVENYLANIHECENNLIRINKQHETANLDSSDKENKITNVRFRNPCKIITKGRPKSVHHNKSDKETKKKVTVGKRKRDQNHCSYCKELGHNIVTCSKKNVERASNEEQTSDKERTRNEEQTSDEKQTRDEEQTSGAEQEQ